MEKINVKPLSFLVSSETEKLLLFSSGEVYGDSPPLNVREDYVPRISETQFRSSYPISKKIAEQHGQVLSDHLGFKFIAARIFHTFGPGVRQDDGRSFADFLWSAAHDKKPILKSSGKDVRSFLYSQDCILAILLLLNDKEMYGPINIGGEESMTIVDFAKRVSCLAGLKGEIVLEESHTDKVKKIVPDITKIKNIGWVQHVSLDFGIERTLSWIRKR
jgi:nucleoside-diphosphate-sugar epimerase